MWRMGQRNPKIWSPRMGIGKVWKYWLIRRGHQPVGGSVHSPENCCDNATPELSVVSVMDYDVSDSWSIGLRSLFFSEAPVLSLNAYSNDTAFLTAERISPSPPISTLDLSPIRDISSLWALLLWCLTLILRTSQQRDHRCPSLKPVQTTGLKWLWELTWCELFCYETGSKCMRAYQSSAKLNLLFFMCFFVLQVHLVNKDARILPKSWPGVCLDELMYCKIRRFSYFRYYSVDQTIPLIQRLYASVWFRFPDVAKQRPVGYYRFSLHDSAQRTSRYLSGVL